MQSQTVPEGADHAGQRSLQDRRSQRAASARGANPRLEVSTALSVIVFLSFGLWWAIWLAVSLLASAVW
jgi:hypothetical protein